VKEGISELFNKDALQGDIPVFIVEGEIDALSIIEVGSQAVALGSTGNKRKFMELCQTTPPTTPIILSLDNDDAGKRTQSEIADALKRAGITFTEQDASIGYKDPNEALKTDREQFKQAVDYASVYALQYAEEADEIRKAETEAEQRKYIAEASVTAQLDDFIGDINSNVDTPVVPTGLSELDKVLDNGLYEGLYVLGAISSLGKTSFLLQIADQIAQQGQDVLIFTLEMAKTELMAKSISRLTFLECKGNINHAKTTRGITARQRYVGYSSEERDLINSSVKKYGEYTDRLFIYEGMGDIGTPQIWEITETHIKSTGNKPIIVIDYLQILAPHEPRATDKQNTDKSVFELKRLSRHYKIPIIAISSLNRENYSTAINMSAFKESGAVEYSSDVLLGLQLAGAGKKEFNVDAEKKKNPRKIELKVLKQRNGATGDSVYFDYFPLFNYFRETAAKNKSDDGQIKF
jgi:replicative DNA helicase